MPVEQGMADEGELTREQIRQISEFINRGLQTSRDRMHALGMAEDALLDPDENLDRQVVKLRALYLEAEKAALAFDSRSEHFWRMLQMRLQPVVLAYSTHEKFIQNLDQDALELRSDLLMEIYRERLDNATRFRQIFFELDDRVKQESTQLKTAAPVTAPAPAHGERLQKVADDSAAIQGNVLKMLERQLRDMEKAFNKKHESLQLANEEILQLKDGIQEKDKRIASLEKAVAQLQESNGTLRLSLDAAQRDSAAAGRNQPAAKPDARPPARERLLDSDKKELLARLDAMEQELATTSDAAYNAFMSNSDLGIVVLFMLSSFRCQSEEQLASEMARSISTFGVKNVVGVRLGSDMHFVASSGADLSLKSQLELNRSKGPVVEGNQLMLYEQNCWVLVQDPPRQDPDRYARLLDNLGTLLRGADARHEAIAAALAVQRQKVQVEQLILRSYEVFQTFEKNIVRQQERIGRALNIFAQDVRKSLAIAAGDPASIRLNMELKKLEDMLRGLLKSSELVDPAFAKNISRVAQGLHSKQKGDG